MRETARGLESHLNTLYKRDKRKEIKPFRGRYIISIKNLKFKVKHKVPV